MWGMAGTVDSAHPARQAAILLGTCNAYDQDDVSSTELAHDDQCLAAVVGA